MDHRQTKVVEEYCSAITQAAVESTLWSISFQRFAVWISAGFSSLRMYEGWNFNFGNTPLDWIQQLLE